MATAAKRQFKADAAIIGLSTSYIIKGGKATRFNTPVRIGREIVSFDRNKDFAEGSYTLIPKAKSQRLGTSHNYTSRKGRHDKAPIKHIKNARVRVLRER